MKPLNPTYLLDQPDRVQPFGTGAADRHNTGWVDAAFFAQANRPATGVGLR
jgi:hypothetical protein